MKKLILICGLLASGFSFGANWTYVTSSNLESFYIDKDFYKYDVKNKTVDVWSKSEKKKIYLDEFYTSSKSLSRYSCINKQAKTLAYINYNEEGIAIKSSTKPEGEFSLIFPDSIGEGMWEVACRSKGKGFVFPEYRPELVPFENIPK